MLEYRLLGRLEVHEGDRLIAIPSRQQRLLLSMLLLRARRTVPTNLLIDVLWGDGLPSDPAAALRTQVSRLRRRLGAGAEELVTDDDGYRLQVGDCAIDAERFERLLDEGQVDAALALWRGRALEEFADRDFAQATAVRLEQLEAAARERRAATYLDAGRAPDAVGDLELLLAADPGRERARALLMEALYSLGRQTEALAVYEAWRRELTEVGLQPDPAMSALEGEILRHRVRKSGIRPPVPVSSFVGREQEIAALLGAFDATRVLTLCGPGGTGKTRLALELAAHLVERYSDGVWFCDLSPLRRLSDVGRAVANAVGLSAFDRDRVGGDLIEVLVDRLNDRRVLLVLDNCEHLLPAVAALVERLVRHTSSTDVLATGRERLGVDGEWVRPVEALDGAAAAQLFTERARATEPTFVADELAVEAICARLDCLPLAIELAAACVKGLSSAELLEALDDPIEVLTVGSRTTERHGSLAAVTQWSYDRLSQDERSAFERFSVFAGRVDLESALSVTGARRRTMLDLVDRYLVASERSPESRYFMLDTLRAYATHRLEERGLLSDARDNHARWVIDMVEEASRELSGLAEAQWAQRIERHLDEIRAAHRWLVGSDPLAALRLSAALHPWAFWRGRAEVFRMAEVAAAAGASTDSPLVADVLASAAVGAWQRGDLDAAQAGAAAARDHRRAVEVLAEVAFLRGDLDRACSLFARAAGQAAAAGDPLQVVWDRGSAALGSHYGGRPVGDEPHTVLAIATAAGSPSARAFAHFVIGEVTGSAADLELAIQLADEVGAEFVRGMAEVSVAGTAARHGDLGLSLDHYERAIRRWHREGLWSSQWVTLRTLVRLLTDLGFNRDASILYGAVRQPRTGPAPYGADAVMMSNTAADLRVQLGPGSFEALLAIGAHLADDDVVELALTALRGARRRNGYPVGDHALTDR